MKYPESSWATTGFKKKGTQIHIELELLNIHRILKKDGTTFNNPAS